MLPWQNVAAPRRGQNRFSGFIQWEFATGYLKEYYVIHKHQPIISYYAISFVYPCVKLKYWSKHFLHRRGKTLAPLTRTWQTRLWGWSRQATQRIWPRSTGSGTRATVQRSHERGQLARGQRGHARVGNGRWSVWRGHHRDVWCIWCLLLYEGKSGLIL